MPRSLRTLLNGFFRRLREFSKSESGMTLPLLAMSLVMITGMVGMAIDTARAQLVQSKLQFSLDAAGLAGGSTVNTASLTSEVTKYLNANFNGYLGATVTSATATADTTNTIITLNATATLPATFLGVVNIHTINVSAMSQISRAVTGLELVLVLDNTGSMTDTAGGGGTKIAALQSAANTLINTLYNGQATAPPNLFIGIVPFSQAVNIGTGHPTWMNTNTYNWYTTSWLGCVDARGSGYDITDDPPSSGTAATMFTRYYWPSDTKATLQTRGGLSATQANTKFNSYTTWASTNSTYDVNLWQGIVASTQRYATPLNSSNWGPNRLCPQEVTPMTTTKSTLTNNINAMIAQGNTVVAQGLQWGWNMISPRWRGQWGGSMATNGLPLDYGTKGMNKAIVLLTDGENTIDNYNHSAYWYLSDNKLGTTNASAAVTQLDTRTAELCTAMKAKGIYIYTIALGTDVPTASQTLLKNCATANNYYFYSPSSSQLQSVFSAIGDSLSNLRVSK